MGVEAVMSSTGKSSSLLPMKIRECAYYCVHDSGMSPMEAVGVCTGPWTVDIVKFLGVTCCVDASICIWDKLKTLYWR